MGIFNRYASILICSTLLVTGCTNIVANGTSDLCKTSKTVAQDYVSKVLLASSFSDVRSAGNNYSLLFSDMEIIDENGNQILFDNLSEAEKAGIVEAWKTSYENQLEEKLKNDSMLRELLSIENDAFFETYSSTEGKNAINVSDFAKFGELYNKNLQKKNKQIKSVRATGIPSDNYIKADCLNARSINIVKNNYQEGNIFVCDDSSSSSGSSVGHASMMNLKKWSPEFESNGLAKATITSWPDPSENQNSYWEGKVNGVQYEPIGYWAGTCSASANSVKLLKVNGQKFVWNWFSSHYEPYDVSPSERESAVAYAENQKGKPYNWNFIAKYDESKFYCSQVVWRAWYNVSTNYDVSIGAIITWVSPADIAASDKTTLLASYTNR